MIDSPENPDESQRVDVAFCIDDATLRRCRAALRSWCVGLIDAAAQVRVVTPSEGAEALSIGGVQIVRHRPLTWPWKRQATEAVIEALTERPPSVVHALAAGGLEVASEIAHHFGADLVVYVLGLPDLEALSSLARDRIDWVIAASQPLLEHAEASEAVVRDRLSLLRPGILANDGPTCFEDADRIPTLLCTRALEPSSGVGPLLDAVRILRGRGHEFLVFLTGRGSHEEALRRTVRSHGLTAAVTFASPLADGREIMAGADIFVRPAVEKSISLRLLQSLGTGTATVAMSGGVGDACVDEETALVCPDDRPSSLAGAIERLLSAPAFARSLATNAVRHIKKHHSVSSSCAGLLSLYRNLALRGRTLTT